MFYLGVVQNINTCVGNMSELSRLSTRDVAFVHDSEALRIIKSQRPAVIVLAEIGRVLHNLSVSPCYAPSFTPSSPSNGTAVPGLKDPS